MAAVVWTADEDGITNVYVAASHDGGGTFSEPRRVNDRDTDASANSEQPPRIALSGSAIRPTVTVVFSKRSEGPQRERRDVIRMARSIDGGQTFSRATLVHDASHAGARGWESLAVASDGSIHMVWLDGRKAERKMAETAAHRGMAHKGQPPQDVYHGTIAADGRIVESLIATDVCFCCKTAVAVDARGAVYVAWRHIFPGSMRDMAFAKSTDAGRHFTPVVRVSEDNWQLNGCPEDGPAMAVDQAGVIHIVWATLITEGEPQKAVFYATSRDGRTFSPRTRIPTAHGTNPGHPQLTLTADGAAIVWDETVEGIRRVSLTRLSRNGVFRPPQILSGDESASHPVIIRSGASDLLVAWTSRPSTANSLPDSSVIKLRRIGAS